MHVASALLLLAAATTAPAADERTRADAEVQAVVAEPSRARWEPMLQTLLMRLRDDGLRRRAVDAAALLERFDVLRERLLAVMDGPDWVRKDGRGHPLVEEARFLLALWGDPRDQAMVEAAIGDGRRIARGPAEVGGKSVEAVLDRWSDHHFRSEGVKRRRPASWMRVLARTSDWAMAEHQVRYAHWGYTNIVVLRKQDRRWRVHLVVQASLDHFAR